MMVVLVRVGGMTEESKERFIGGRWQDTRGVLMWGSTGSRHKGKG
jgi:hypothetical protein